MLKLPSAIPLFSLTAIVIILFSSSAHAGIQVNQAPIDLLKALNMSLEHAPEWQSQQKQIAAQQENRTQARSRLLPDLSLTAQTAKTKTEQGTADSEGNTHAYTLNLTQPLFQLERWFQYKAAENTFDQLEHQLKAQYQAFIITVTERYLEVLRAESQLTFSEAELTATQQQLEQIQQRFSVGLTAITDVHEAQAAYDLAEVNQIASATELDIAYENLSRLTGSLIANVHKVHPDMPISDPTPSNMSDWVTRAQAENPSVLAARAAQQARKASLRAAHARSAPTLNLVASHTDSNAVTNHLDTDTSTVAIQLSAPLFTGFNTSSVKKQAELEFHAATDTLTAEIKDATQSTRNLYRSVHTDVSRVKARRQAIISSSSALEATEAGYEVGTRNVVDVLNAQRSLFAAKRDYANARYDFILHTLQLKQAAGTLTAHDGETLNQWLSTTR